MKRLDAKGNLISEKKHNISFRADLYEINEVESYKNAMKEQKFWEKCCKLCSIQ